MTALVCAGENCGRAIRPNQPYTYREIIGREQVSRSGGVGAVKVKEYTGRVFCPDCGGGQPAESLFDQ